MKFAHRKAWIALLATIAVAVAACGVPLSRDVGSPVSADILLFVGRGTWSGDVAAVEEILRDKSFRYSTASSEQLNAMSEAQLHAFRLPLTPPLAEALAGWQGSGLTFLETAYGRPFSADGLSNAFRDWCDAADLPQCTFHGLRKAAATRLAEAGCTPHQIMAVLGHTTHQQAALYTRAADRAGMADQALGRLYGEQMDPPVDLGGSNSAKKS